MQNSIVEKIKPQVIINEFVYKDLPLRDFAPSILSRIHDIDGALRDQFINLLIVSEDAPRADILQLIEQWTLSGVSR
ncbi:MAG: hypothetical protein AB8B67_02840 [Rickettsiaceae bacterium]